MAIFHLYIYSDSLPKFLIHKLDNLFAYIWASKSCDYCAYYTAISLSEVAAGHPYFLAS